MAGGHRLAGRVRPRHLAWRRDPTLSLSQWERDSDGEVVLAQRLRDARGRVIVTSNKSFADWGEGFNDQVLATAILDRLLPQATTLNIKGESDRLREKKKAGLLGQRSVTAAEEVIPDAAL